ncbi:unnamed protein product [Microthlaspi erraticum]|uniref:Uncharacterized protein n=1 Tax=Microthlaspi erraticum TaxID=1685480 RepID=A0A6D2I2L5_9BRAS|nr:unnamed protein product [Microthlaspi erraticum]
MKDIFVTYTRGDNINRPSVFKLNVEGNVWDEKRDLGGLALFTSYPGSFARACSSAEHRNKMYTSCIDDCWLGLYDMYYSLSDEESSRLPSRASLSPRVAWVDPPHKSQPP